MNSGHLSQMQNRRTIPRLKFVLLPLVWGNYSIFISSLPMETGCAAN